MRFCSPASEFTQNVRLPQHTLFDMRILSPRFTQFSQSISPVSLHRATALFQYGKSGFHFKHAPSKRISCHGSFRFLPFGKNQGQVATELPDHRLVARGRFSRSPIFTSIDVTVFISGRHIQGGPVDLDLHAESPGSWKDMIHAVTDIADVDVRSHVDILERSFPCL